MSAFRFRLTRGQFELLSALNKQSELKRQMIQVTPALPPQTTLWLAPYQLTVHAVLGSGLVGTVYRVSTAQGQTYALKQARASFSFFREILRLERAVENLLNQQPLTAFRPAKTVAYHELGLLKEYWDAPTLQALLFEKQLSDSQKNAFLTVLAQAATLWQTHQVGLDLSPKNLCWDAQSQAWILLDTGPKIHQSAFWQVYLDPCWETYQRYTDKKLSQAASQPSVLTLDAPGQSVSAQRYAFIRDWFFWVPYDAEADADYFFVELDETQTEWEILYTYDTVNQSLAFHADGDPHWQAAPLVQACAIQSWKTRWGDCPFQAQFDEAVAQEDVLAHKLGLHANTPVSLNQLAAESQGLLKRLLPQTPEPTPLPTLEVPAYTHWSELFEPGASPYAIYCQDPLPSDPTPLDALRASQPTFELQLRDESGRGFMDIVCFPQRNTRRALLCLPGFRASQTAVAPLLQHLIDDDDIDGLLMAAYLGVRNPGGGALLSAGRWESLMLWRALDHLLTYQGVEEIVILAASYGAIAPLLVAPLCPAVRGFVFDSAIIRPMDMLDTLGRAQGLNPASLRAHVRAHAMPDADFSLTLETLGDLPYLALYPEQDKFAQICGQLVPEPHLVYQGRHAATMRHDSHERGIPPACIEAIVNFLKM